MLDVLSSMLPKGEGKCEKQLQKNSPPILPLPPQPAGLSMNYPFFLSSPFCSFGRLCLQTDSIVPSYHYGLCNIPQYLVVCVLKDSNFSPS